MITLAIINKVISIMNYLCTHVFSDFYTHIVNYQNYLSGLQAPQTLIDIFALAKYFLPFGTITVLFEITVGLVLISLIYAFIYMTLNIIKQVPLL